MEGSSEREARTPQSDHLSPLPGPSPAERVRAARSRSAELGDVSCGAQSPPQPQSHPADCFLRHAKRQLAVGFDAEQALRPAATLWSGVANSRAHIALYLEPIQRRIDGANRDTPSGSFLDFTADRHAVCVLLQLEE